MGIFPLVTSSRTPHGASHNTLCYFWVMLDMGIFHALLLVPFAWAYSLRGADKKMGRACCLLPYCFPAPSRVEVGFLRQSPGSGLGGLSARTLTRSENGLSLKVQAPPTYRNRGLLSISASVWLRQGPGGHGQNTDFLIGGGWVARRETMGGNPVWIDLYIPCHL